MNKKRKYQTGGQNLGFDGTDPYFDRPALDPYADVLKAAGSAYLGNSISSKAYFDWLHPDDPAKAKRLSKRSAVLSGLVGAGSALVTQNGERRDYEANAKWIADRRAQDYYRVPYDRYSYNENLSNPYNQTGYKMGGRTRWQDGGSTVPEGFEPDYAETPETPQNDEQVVFDSTPQPEDQGYAQYDRYEDDLPVKDDGMYDLSAFEPTLGNAPLRYSTDPNSIEGTISQIANHESGGDYGVVNTSGGSQALNATGKYQFVPKYWHQEIAKFQGTEGKTQAETMEIFRKSPSVQDAFMSHVVRDKYLPEVKELLPYAKRYGLDQNALIKMLHYRGIADTERRLKTGDFTVSQNEKRLYNNPDILKYVRG